MRMTVRLGALALAVLVADQSSAVFAQGPRGGYGGTPRPTYSPYLNLTRRGDPAINYYGLVRPELEFRNSINTLSQQYGQLNRDVNAAEAASTDLATGHAVGFQTHLRYFGNFAGGRPGTGGSRPAAGIGGGFSTAPMTSTRQMAPTAPRR